MLQYQQGEGPYSLRIWYSLTPKGTVTGSRLRSGKRHVYSLFILFLIFAASKFNKVNTIKNTIHP